VSADNAWKIKSHRDLIVWQKAMDLVDEIYDLSQELPPEEKFGLKSQLTRAAVSVPTNIAEGRGRATSREFAHFLNVAWSSLLEIDTLLEITRRRAFLSEARLALALALHEEVGKMLVSLEARIRARNHQRSPRIPNPSSLIPVDA
jgi:four helix bundle protein